MTTEGAPGARGKDCSASERVERRRRHVELNAAQVTRLIQPLFPGGRALEARLLPGGRCNSNYRVTVAGRSEPVLLRVHVQDPSACAREAALHRLLRGRLPVPEVLHADPTPRDSGWCHALYQWVEGAAMEEWLPTAAPAEVARVARGLAKAWVSLRAVRFEAPGFLGPDLRVPEPVEDFAELCLTAMEGWLREGRAGRRLGPELSESVLDLVRENRPLLEPVRGERSLVHADFRPENLLVREGRGGWELAAILDWEFAHSGTGLFDLGQLFRVQRLLPPGFEEAFTEGAAQAGYALPPHWRLTGKLIDFTNLVCMLNDPEDQPRWHEDLKHLISAAVRDWPG